MPPSPRLMVPPPRNYWGEKPRSRSPQHSPAQSQVKGWERQTPPRTTATTNPQRGESRGRYIIHNQQCSWKRTKRSLKATRSQLSRPRVPAAVLGSLPRSVPQGFPPLHLPRSLQEVARPLRGTH